MIDNSIDTITGYRRSKVKFRLLLIVNLLTLGILHLVSLFIPRLYLLLYCKESTPTTSDYFLIKDIYNKYTICDCKRKKIEMKKDSFSQTAPMGSSTGMLLNTQNQTQTIITFEYNYTIYIFSEKNYMFSPIYFDLSKMTNKNIHSVYCEGLQTSEMLNQKKIKFGDNVFPIKISNVYLFFLAVELPTFICVVLSAIIWLIERNYVFGGFELALTSIISIYKVLYKKRSLIETNSVLNTKKEITKYYSRVKRKFLKKENVDYHKSQNYVYVNPKEIYPGDILIIKSGDTMECDGLLLEGECLVSECKTEGTTSYTRKTPLESNGNLFVYEENKKSILYQGMSIIKCNSKLEDKSALVLVINTGANTTCANVYAKLIYQHKLEFNILYQNRMSHFILNIVIFIISVCVLITIKKLTHKAGEGESKIKDNILKSLATALTPTYHLTLSIVYLFGNINLKRQGIQCVDDSRLCLAGKVTTVVLDKTGTISEEKLEIVGYHPIYKINNELSIKTFTMNYLKTLSREHLKFYTSKLKQIEANQKEKEMNNILFLECLFTCHSLERVHNEICGNLLELDLFNKLKWDINSIEIKIPNTNTDISTIEAYPNNYYKITEKDSFSSKEKKANPYKLQIIKRFYTNSSLHIGSIVYNTLDMSLRFNIKGSPEEILSACNPKTIPSTIKSVLGIYRREGYRLVVFASKLIDYASYRDDNTENIYMNNLTFVGFITVKNRLKEETIEVVSQLQKMKCEVLMCTGDGAFTSLAVGYDSKIISDKNIYIFDMDESEQIMITHLYKNEEDKNILIGSGPDTSGIEQGSKLPKKVGTQQSFLTERKPMLENTSLSIKGGIPQVKLGEISNLNNTNNTHDKQEISNVRSNDKEDISVINDNINSTRQYNQMLSFVYDPEKLSSMKHNSIFCMSGKVFSKIYSDKVNNKKLLKFLKHLGKLYFSFSSQNKVELMNFYKEMETKTVCMVGDGPNDTNAILTSHVGIRINVSKNNNETNLTHFYSSEGITCIEKIIKNGRACFENTILLYTFVIISSSLESLLNIYSSYYVIQEEDKSERVILDFIIFFLSCLAFRTKADTSINYNDLFQSKSFTSLVIAKNIIVILFKFGVQMLFIFIHKDNENIQNEDHKNKVKMGYLYIIIAMQTVSTLFTFNKENYFRKHYSQNRLLNFVLLFVDCFFLVMLGVSNRFLSIIVFSFVTFENSEYELDHHDDFVKLIVISILVIEFVLTNILTSIVRQVFEWLVNKNKDKKIKKEKTN